MDDLVQWLRAQLDEDARRASSWHTLECDIHAYLQGDMDSVRATMSMFHEAPGAVCDCNVPARVLREIDAKRRILRALESAEVALRNTEPGMEPHELMTGSVNSLRAAVRLLALPYSDRPGYREEWRP